MLLIADPGSTHMGNKKYVEEITFEAKKAGFDVVKWQLFPDTDKFKPNIHMSLDLFDHALASARRHKIGCTASVFGRKEAEFLMSKKNLPFIKFGFSERNSDFVEGFLKVGRDVIVTTSVMERHLVPQKAKTLYAHEVNGKVTYPCTSLIDFEGLFPLFDGFSDHTLGVKQAQHAKKAGAKIIEKHITLGYSDIDCPDNRFALHVDEWKDFVKGLR